VGFGKEKIEMRRLPAYVRGLLALAALAALAGAALLGYRPVSAEQPEQATFVGEKKCRACHFKEYRSWKKTKHAGAWDSLEEKDRTREACVRCHVTGHGEQGGFVSEERTPRLKGVQCESCHGPGSAHVDAAKDDQPEEKVRPLINKVPQNTCVKCHNTHKTLEDFKREAEEEEKKAKEK
jgi:ribosomal protein L40E